MSGAETAGLAIGVIALASLFTTCLELLDYFELGKNYLYDYRLACIKTNLLHERLSTWGRATNILHKELQHPALRTPVVRASLEVLRDTLFHAEGLRAKYDLKLPIAQLATDSSAGRARPRKLAVWTLHLRRRTTWSIRDKAKFDRFIYEIRVLLEDLERVTGTPYRSSVQDIAFTYRDLLKMHPTKDTDYGKNVEGGLRGSGSQRRQPAPKDADFDGLHAAGGAVQTPRRSATTSSDETSDDSGGTKGLKSTGRSSKTGPALPIQAQAYAESSYCEVSGADLQIENNGFTVLGSIGSPKGSSVVREPKYKAGDGAYTLVGAVSEDGLAVLLAAHRESVGRSGGKAV